MKRIISIILLLLSILSKGWVFPLSRYPQQQSQTKLKVGSLKGIEEIEGSWNSTTFASTQCWGQRPLLLRNAFNGVGFPSWNEIIELACNNDDEEELTSRLIQHKPGTLDTFTLSFGPFQSQHLDKTMDNDETKASTLVVNDVDRWIPSVSDWMDVNFDFLPRWRRDDAQVSLAKEFGGIGPHVDNYDVFLIQVSGSREWEVGLDTISVQEEFANLVGKSEVRILNITMPSIKFHLKAGDCLYLPPRYMHWGTSTSADCMTLSVGCRAPSANDIFSKMSELISTSSKELAVRRYTDIDLLQSTNDKSLSTKVKDKMKTLLLDVVQETLNDEAIWDDLVGCMVTEPNRQMMMEYPIPLSAMDSAWKEELGIWADAEKTLDAFLEGKGVLRRAEGISYAWSKVFDSYNLYAQGRAFPIHDSPTSTGLMLECIANGPPLNQKQVHDMGIEMTQSIRDFLLELLEEGLLYGDHPVE